MLQVSYVEANDVACDNNREPCRKFPTPPPASWSDIRQATVLGPRCRTATARMRRDIPSDSLPTASTRQPTSGPSCPLDFETPESIPKRR